MGLSIWAAVEKDARSVGRRRFDGSVVVEVQTTTEEAKTGHCLVNL